MQVKVLERVGVALVTSVVDAGGAFEPCLTVLLTLRSSCELGPAPADEGNILVNSNRLPYLRMGHPTENGAKLLESSE